MSFVGLTRLGLNLHMQQYKLAARGLNFLLYDVKLYCTTLHSCCLVLADMQAISTIAFLIK